MTNDLTGRLCQLLPSPHMPLYNEGDWKAVESSLGVVLPEDYKGLVNVFGQGMFVGHEFLSGLSIASYLGPPPPVVRAKGFAAYFGTLGAISYGIYPDSPGLLDETIQQSH